MGADAVDGTKLADDAVASEHIATDAVTSDAIAAGAVGSSEIADASVANADLVNDGITIGSTDASLGGTYTTLAGLTSVSSTGFTGNLTGNVTGDLTGDVYSSNGTMVLDAGTDGTDASFTGSVSGGISGDVTGNILADNGTTVVLNNGAAADGSDATFTGAVTGNASTATTLETARNFSVSGDATTGAPVSFNGSGNVDLAISLSADAVGSAEIANDAVGSTEIATGAVGTSEIADASVANADLVNDGITIGSTDASLGGTYTTLTGLTSVSSTGFTGNLSGNVTGNLTGQVLTASQTSITTMANLTTVGTIGTGTWQGTAVADTYVADDLTINAGDIDNTPIDGSTIGATTAAAADVTTLTVEDATIMNESRDQAGDVLTIYDDGVGNVMTVSSTTGVHISDLTLNDSFTLTGNMSASTYTTTAGDPTNDNELARKAYVDAQIAANVSAFEVFDYNATASTINNTGGGNLTYYLNGANLFYQDNTAGDSNNASNGYTFTVYGSGMDQITTAELYLRGTSVDLVNNNNWASSGSAAATFTLTYQNLLDLSGGSQTDGVMRCHLVLDGKNSGLTFKFRLDSTSSAATTASFN